MSSKSTWAAKKSQGTPLASERHTKADYEKFDINKAKVNPDLFTNEKWLSNFDRISDNPDVNNAVRNLAEQMLKHRDGTFYEDMYLINAATGAVEGFNTTSNEWFGVPPNKSLISALNKQDVELIGIHNHPLSSVPSTTDLNALVERSSQSKGIIICHDGTIFTYTKPSEEISQQVYDVALKKYDRYSKMTREDKGFQELCNIYKFSYERIEI